MGIFKDKIVKYQASSGLSLKKISEKAGVSEATLYKALEFEGNVMPKTIKKILAAIGEDDNALSYKRVSGKLSVNDLIAENDDLRKQVKRLEMIIDNLFEGKLSGDNYNPLYFPGARGQVTGLSHRMAA